jgi:hypothetical protein
MMHIINNKLFNDVYISKSMKIIQSIKSSINNLVDSYHSKNKVPEKNIGIRFIQAPSDVGANYREVQRYNTLTNETIPSENKVYLFVFSLEAVERWESLKYK